MERLCNLGVLEHQQASEWALPSFVIPKKDESVHFLSNFWVVNTRLVRTPFPIPKISMVLQELEGFSFATALDLNMVITPLDWIQMHPKSAPSSYLGENIPRSNCQWVLQVLQMFSKVKMSELKESLEYV